MKKYFTLLACLHFFLLPAVYADDELKEFAEAFLEKASGNADKKDAPPVEEPAAVVSSSETSSEPAQTEVSGGLKAALAQGVDVAVKTLGKEDGFLSNELVKITMPDMLQKVQKGLSAVGQDKLAENFVLAMNRAAEQAVPETAEILGNAVNNMSVDDAMQILQGADDAATEYFRRVSESELLEKITPTIKQATDAAGVTAAYKALMQQAGPLSGLLGDSMDIDKYVTQKSLDGLFKTIAEEEKRIRENPVARTSDLLKQVFGKLSGE